MNLPEFLPNDIVIARNPFGNSSDKLIASIDYVKADKEAGGYYYRYVLRGIDDYDFSESELKRYHPANF